MNQINPLEKPLLILLLAAILFCCTKKQPQTKLNTQSEAFENFRDTIVKITPLKLFENKIVVTNEIAANTLHNHFKSKGFLIQSDIDENLNIPRLPQNKGKNVIEFVGVNWFNNDLGVIYYYNAPVGSVGHCVQPHNAIISNSEIGLTISNEEFIPVNFSIDSTKTIDNKYIIYAIDYDCYDKVVLEKYRIEIEK